MPAAPRTLGDYDVLEPLGRGGMGIVYRARHRGTGAAVALKTVQVVDAALLSSIRREIHALADLRHPGVVHILEVGTSEGVPWYAMELVDGVSLESFAWPGTAPVASGMLPTVPISPEESSAWWTRRLDDVTGGGAPEARARERPDAPPHVGLAGALRIVHRLCAPLAYLHGEGIVHRDLKPANVLVRPGGWPVILDFGLVTRFAAALAREELQVEGEAVGTVAYVAPEQGEGQTVDARADLYALGCILYELVTGRPPFQGSNPYETLSRRYRETPAPPRELRPEVPAALDELVLKLLEREPRRRLGYASDVALALGAIIGTLEPGTDLSPEVGQPAPRPYLYRPDLRGRDDLLEQISSRLGRLFDGEGGLLLLRGESGVGKTRLAMGVTGRAVAMRVRTLLGECSVAGLAGSEPLRGLRRPLAAIADLCRESGEEVARRVLGPRAALLALFEPALAHVPGIALPPVADLPPDAARRRLWGALADTFVALAALQPVMLVLDDVQWADELTLGFLEVLGRRSRRHPVLVLALYRSEEEGPALARLAARAGVQAIEVPRLGAEAVGALAADMLALDPLPEGFAPFLARHSEGNPFFVAEYLHAAVGESLLKRDPETGWAVAGAEPGKLEALPLPGSIRDVVSRRLSDLGPAEQGLVEMASVLGRELRRELLEQAAALAERVTDRALAALLRRQILEEPAPGLVRFAHDKLREVAYAGLPAARRRELHRAAAAALEVAGSARQERLAELGRHYEGAGDTGRARACYLPAARRAAGTFALDEAERLYRAHLRLASALTEDDVEARHELAEKVLLQRGDVASALTEQERALAEADRLGSTRCQAQCFRALGVVHRQRGDLPAARAAYERALPLARAAGETRLEGRTLGNLGNVLWRDGKLAEAKAHYEAALRIFRACGDRDGIATEIGHLGNIARDEGDREAARARYEEALAPIQGQDPTSEASLLGNLAILDAEAGDLQSALARQGRGLELVRGTGDRYMEAASLTTLAMMTMQAGRRAEAEPMFRRAIQIAQDVEDWEDEIYALEHLALLLRQSRRRQEALRTLRDAAALAQEHGAPAEAERLRKLAAARAGRRKRT